MPRARPGKGRHPATRRKPDSSPKALGTPFVSHLDLEADNSEERTGLSAVLNPCSRDCVTPAQLSHRDTVPLDGPLRIWCGCRVSSAPVFHVRALQLAPTHPCLVA